MEHILKKCYYKCDYLNFDEINKFWELNFKAKFQNLSENTVMMTLDKNSIELMKKIDKIPVDCRIFAFLCSKLKDSGCYLILQKNENGIEIETNDCFYLSLSPENNLFQIKDRKIELKSCLKDKQGQWLKKSNDNRYIGICNDGILHMPLCNWFNYWFNLVKKTINSFNFSLNSNDINRCSRMGLLKNCIDKKGLILSLYKFDNFGRNIEIEKFTKNLSKKKNRKSI